MPETMKNSCLLQAEEGEPERCMERCMERWKEGSEDPEVWSMEDRRLVESYQITIRENGMVVLSQRELMKERERKLERRKNSLSRKELFAELDKVVEEQELKSVTVEKKEQNSVENTPLNDDDDDRCLEIAIEEAKQEAAEMKEEMKKKKKRRGRRGNRRKRRETKKAVRTRIRRRKWCVNRVRVNT